MMYSLSCYLMGTLVIAYKTSFWAEKEVYNTNEYCTYDDPDNVGFYKIKPQDFFPLICNTGGNLRVLFTGYFRLHCIRKSSAVAVYL